MAYVTRISGRDIVDNDYNIEGSYIVEIAGPTTVQGVGTGVCAIVGEFLKGPTDEPVEIFSSEDLINTFGGWSDYSNPGFSNVTGSESIDPSATAGVTEGNGYLSIYGKKYPRLFICRVDDSVATCDLTLSGAIALTIPAGATIADDDASNIFAFCDDLVIEAADYVSGSVTFKDVPLRRVKGTTLTPTLTQLPDLVNILTAADQETDAVEFTSVTLGAVTDLTQAEIESRYSDAIDLLDIDDVDFNKINIVWTARHTANIYGYLKTNAVDASSKNYAGRCYVVSPEVGSDKTAIQGSTGVAVGNTSICRFDRCWFAGTEIEQNFPFITADPIKELSMDSTLVSRVASLPPEYNPAQIDDGWATWIVGLGGNFKSLKKADYVAFRAKGICAINMDPSFGAQVQSGVTSVDPAVYPTKRNIARRRIADYITGSLAQYAAQYKSKPYSKKNYNNLCLGVENLLYGLVRDERIAGYTSDYLTGNTADKVAQGIVTIILKVRTLSSMDFITFKAEIGETVEITAQ